ncbi:MAG: hypothetical protein C0404_09675 [Verrucomicrobia bacterium]|nr:hypothetical protein [Verrucomicrobiota bacterium]
MTMNEQSTLQKVIGGTTGLIALLAILVAGNYVIRQQRVAKLDLTDGKLYTLSAGTRKIISNLDNEVTLMFFYSSSYAKMPSQVKTYAKEVEDLLKEYASVSRGKIKLEKYDPEPDSDAEELAQKLGIMGQSTEMFGPPVYLGVAARMGKDDVAIPALDPRQEELLEYNVTRLINRVAHPEKPVVGVLGGLPVMGMQAPPMGMMPGQRPRNQPAWILFQELMQDYDLKDLPAATTEEIPPEVKLLIVVHPKNFSEKTLFAIDQFVLRGGRLLTFMDPLCLIDSSNPYESMMGGGQKSSSTLGKLLTAWGVTFEADKVVADMKSTTRVQSENGVDDTPVWLSIRTNGLNRSDIITVNMNAIMLPLAGALSAADTKDLKVTPLIKSSETACTVNGFTAQMGGQMLLTSFKSAGTPFNLAIKLHGKFKTAFPEGKPKDDPQGTNAVDLAAAAVKGLTEGQSTVVLVADVDMIYDSFCMDTMDFLGAKNYQPKNDNYKLFYNTIEQLTGSTELMELRSRGRLYRPYDKVVALHEKAMNLRQEEVMKLEEELKKTQTRLQELQNSKDKSQRRFNDQKKLVSEFKLKELEIKKRQKAVNKELRREIENLGVLVKGSNILLMPLLVICIGVGFGLYRISRR